MVRRWMPRCDGHVGEPDLSVRTRLRGATVCLGATESAAALLEGGREGAVVTGAWVYIWLQGTAGALVEGATGGSPLKCASGRRAATSARGLGIACTTKQNQRLSDGLYDRRICACLHSRCL